MTEIEKIKQKLTALNEEERALKADIAKRKERIKKAQRGKEGLDALL